MLIRDKNEYIKSGNTLISWKCRDKRSQAQKNRLYSIHACSCIFNSYNLSTVSLTTNFLMAFRHTDLKLYLKNYGFAEKKHIIIPLDLFKMLIRGIKYLKYILSITK